MRWALLFVCVAGCTQVLGLDGARDDDRDGDHIPDGSDNCPDVPNTDQSRHDLSDPRGDACRVCMTTDPTDSDGDGIPDKCDGCDNRLPDNNHNGVPDACENPHDEDGDGVPDLVDNCPSVANPDQADTTESLLGPSVQPDGVGDACDDTPGRDTQLFDSFAERNELWIVRGAPWQDGNDHALVDITQPFPSRLAGLGLPTFTVTTALTITGTGGAGVIALDASSRQLVIECGLVAAETGRSMTVVVLAGGQQIAGSKGSPVTQPDPVLVSMRVEPGAALGTTGITCTVGELSVTVSLIDSGTVWHPGLIAAPPVGVSTKTGTAQFDYFDIVTTSP